MGTFHVAVEVGNLEGDRWELVDALVDTGASHSIFPSRLLRGLGIQSTERWPFRLADERQREFDVGAGQVRLFGRQAYTRLVFGDEGMQPLLGAVALEELGLGVDPVGQTLVPVPGLLMTLLDSSP